MFKIGDIVKFKEEEIVYLHRFAACRPPENVFIVERKYDSDSEDGNILRLRSVTNPKFVIHSYECRLVPHDSESQEETSKEENEDMQYSIDINAKTVRLHISADKEFDVGSLRKFIMDMQYILELLDNR